MKKRGRKTSLAAQVRTRVNMQLVAGGWPADSVGFADDDRFVIQRMPTGSLVMDRVMGGGLPRGRHVELFGDYHAGKSVIMYMTMALAQQRGEVAALIDGEKVFDKEWFAWLGGIPEDLLIYRPRTAEQVIKTLQLFGQADKDNPGASIVGIDSVASLLPKEEEQKDVEEGDDRTAGRARMMSRLLRRVTSVNENTAFLWTNQYIDQVSGYGGKTTPGGRALKHYASIRVEMKKLDQIKKPRKRVKKGKVESAATSVGHWVGIKAEKQKTGRPAVESMLLFDYERKIIDPEYEIIHLGLEDGLISRSGNTFRYEDSNGDAWGGQESQFRKFLENPELREELVWAITENTLRIQEGDDNGEE